jgi:hypothetical protein
VATTIDDTGNSSRGRKIFLISGALPKMDREALENASLKNVMSTMPANR